MVNISENPQKFEEIFRGLPELENYKRNEIFRKRKETATFSRLIKK